MTRVLAGLYTSAFGRSFAFIGSELVVWRLASTIGLGGREGRVVKYYLPYASIFDSTMEECLEVNLSCMLAFLIGL